MAGLALLVFGVSLIVNGEPYASGYADTAQYECFPPALRFKLGDDDELSDVQAEPIAADADDQLRDRVPYHGLDQERAA